MSTTPVTLTLPFLTQQGLNVILTMLGIILATGLMWLALNPTARKLSKGDLTGVVIALAWVLGLVWLWLLGATFWGLWQVFNGVKSPLADGSLGLGALIAAFLGAPFVIYGTYLRHKTNRLEQEGHMTDRINAAIEQLGADKTIKREGKEETVPNIEVRMGAILSLERIAQDSTILDKGRDHVRVMEILCSYIRENSNARKPVDFPLLDWEPLDDDAVEEEQALYLASRRARFKSTPEPLARRWAQILPKPRADVQLALRVIGRRNERQRSVEAAWPNPPSAATVWPYDTAFKRLPEEPMDELLGKAALDFFKTGLQAWKATLESYRGYRLDLRGANLQSAGMDAKQPDGSDAVFSGAMLNYARMEGADVRCARMEGANLTGAQIEGASLWGARMEGADLSFARMEGATFWRAHMEGTDLSNSKIDGANLGGARLEGASLWGTQLEVTDLTRARLDGANLFDARMGGAKLKNISLINVYVSQGQINEAFGDDSVILPESATCPEHWSE